MGRFRAMLAGESPSLREGVLWNSIGNTVYLAAQWLLTFSVVRVLGYEEAGVLSVAMVFGNVCSSIALYSMRSYQVSDVSDRYRGGTYVASRCATSAASVVVCAACLLVQGCQGETLLCVGAYLLFKLTEAFCDVYQGMMQKSMRLDFVGMLLGARGALTLTVFVVSMLLSRSLLIALLIMSAVSAAFVALADRGVAYRVSVRGPLGSVRDVLSLLRSCFPVAFYGVLFTAAGQIPRLFIEAQCGSEQLGIYTSIALPAVIVQTFASFFFNPLATPFAVCYHEGDGKGFRALFGKVSAVLGVISLASLLASALLGDVFLGLLFGPSIQGYSYLFPPLVACAVLTALCWFVATVLVSFRELGVLSVASVVSVVAVVVCCPLMMQAAGMNGATFALLVSLAVFLAVAFLGIRKVWRSLAP